MEIIFQIIFWIAVIGGALALAAFLFPALVVGAITYMITGSVTAGTVVMLITAVLMIIGALAGEF